VDEVNYDATKIMDKIIFENEAPLFKKFGRALKISNLKIDTGKKKKTNYFNTKISYALIVVLVNYIFS
jgi:hypothetical protein